MAIKIKNKVSKSGNKKIVIELTEADANSLYLWLPEGSDNKVVAELEKKLESADFDGGC